MPDQSQPFSAVQTVIPTPYPDSPAETVLPRSLPSPAVQTAMFAFPDVMRGQLALGTDDV